MAEPLVFQGLFETFLQEVPGSEAPAFRAKLRAAGIDLDGKLLPAYPMKLFVDLCELTARELLGHLPREEALFRLGVLGTEGFGRHFLGRALFGVLRVIGPRRALLRMNQNLASNWSHVRVTFEERSPMQIDCTFTGTAGMHDYFRGLIHSGGTVAGAKQLVVTTLTSGPDSATYRVDWAA